MANTHYYAKYLNYSDMILTPEAFTNKLLGGLPTIFRDEMLDKNKDVYNSGVKITLTTGDELQYVTVKMADFTYMVVVNNETAEIKVQVFCASKVVNTTLIAPDFLYNVDKLLEAFDRIVTHFRFVNRTITQGSEDIATTMNKLNSMTAVDMMTPQNHEMADIDG